MTTLLVLLGLLAPPLSADLDGREIAPQARPRIVSLSPAQTETLYAIGAGGDLVAASDYCNHPPAARKLPKVGALTNLSVEKVVAHRPTLLVAASGSREQWKHLQKVTGAPVFVATDGGIAAVRSDLRALGRICKREAAAAALERRIDTKLREVRAASAGKPRPRVFYLVWDDPLMSAGKGSYLDDLIREAGGRNVTGDRSEPYPRLSWETLLAAPPDVIVGPSNLRSVVAAAARKTGARRWAVLDQGVASRPGPRVIEALDLFHGAIHGKTAAPAKTHP
ncbi:MAG: ABC transporter substrate-binding protein [Candidatus Sericytochromatia bacterium]|nr:ABC transporter substrate-binding protein [Candidatus Tanganyikabacteria bacterium]